MGTLTGHKKAIFSSSFSPVSQTLLTSSSDGTMKIWSLKDMTCLQTLEGSSSSILKACWMGFGKQVLSVGGDGVIRIWEIRTGSCLESMEGHDDKIWGLDVTGDGSGFITGSGDGRVIFWRDVTQEENQKKHELEALSVKENQDLANLWAVGAWVSVFEKGLSLGRPGMLKDVFEVMMRKQHTEEEKEKEKEFDFHSAPFNDSPPSKLSPSTMIPTTIWAQSETLKGINSLLKELSPSHLVSLFKYLEEWNRKPSTFAMSQWILSLLLEALPESKTRKLVKSDSSSNLASFSLGILSSSSTSSSSPPPSPPTPIVILFYRPPRPAPSPPMMTSPPPSLMVRVTLLSRVIPSCENLKSFPNSNNSNDYRAGKIIDMRESVLEIQRAISMHLRCSIDAQVE